jgi:branched-subunit amino acid transport protein AzlD
MTKPIRRISKILGSNRFFWAIIIFFIFESVWIAVSALYPQAFDEDFHFGLIKIYARYWFPFFTNQPANANAYGAVAVDPSYLYHYLMSFPYRLIDIFTHDQTIQVIVLRLFSVGFFTAGLVLFRKVLLRARISKALANVSLAIFVLIPIVPQLAAHINYDNLLFPLIAWITLLTFNVIDDINHKQASINNLLILVVVCLFTSLVKDAFLPIFLGAILFLAYLTWRAYRHKFKKYIVQLKVSWQQQSVLYRVILAILLIMAVGIFVERDIANLVRYHAIEPQCSAVLSVKDCSSYSAWLRNYDTHQTVVANRSAITFFNPIIYFGTWLYWMWYRLFFAVNGPASQFTNYPPLPIPSATAALIALIGVFFVFKYRRKIFKGNPYVAFLLVICSLYILSLLVDGYAQYRYTNELVAMNGRYLIPVLLLFGAIIGSAFSFALRNLPIRKTIIAAVVLVLFLQGGGFLTFITRSDTTWDWSNNIIVKMNNTARKITKPIIVKGSKTYTTKYWIFN